MRRERRAHPQDMARLIEVLGNALESAATGIEWPAGKPAWVSSETKVSAGVEWGLREYRQHKRRYGDNRNHSQQRRG